MNNFGFTHTVTANIGIGNNGQFAMTGPGTIDGTIYFAAANTGQFSLSNSTLKPSINNPLYSQPIVGSALGTINTLSSTLGA
jgi:hypothetical protein